MDIDVDTNIIQSRISATCSGNEFFTGIAQNGDVTCTAVVISQALNDLTDVDLTTAAPVSNDLLQFNGANWIPKELTSTDSSLSITPSVSGIDFQVAGVGSANGIASLDGAGMLPVSQLPMSVLQLLGVWDASANNPTLATGDCPSGGVAVGEFYTVGTAGVTVINGIGSWTTTDWILCTSSGWAKNSHTNLVTSWNGLTGAVTADHANLNNIPTNQHIDHTTVTVGGTGPNNYITGGSNIASSVELDIDTTKIQTRVQACSPGEAIQSVAVDGSVTCETVGTGTVNTFGGTSIDNRLVRYDGTDGTSIQSSVIDISDLGDVTGVNDLGVAGSITVNGLVDGVDVSAHAADSSIHFEIDDAATANETAWSSWKIQQELDGVGGADLSTIMSDIATLQSQVSTLQSENAAQQSTIDEIVMNLTMAGAFDWPMEILDSGTVNVRQGPILETTSTWTLEKVTIGSIELIYLEIDGGWSFVNAAIADLNFEFVGISPPGVSSPLQKTLDELYTSIWPWFTSPCTITDYQWIDRNSNLSLEFTLATCSGHASVSQTGTLRVNTGPFFIYQ